VRGKKILAHGYAEAGPVGDLDFTVLNRERFFDELVQERVGAERVLYDEPGGRCGGDVEAGREGRSACPKVRREL
jgi:hypothetical protein